MGFVKYPCKVRPCEAKLYCFTAVMDVVAVFLAAELSLATTVIVWVPVAVLLPLILAVQVVTPVQVLRTVVSRSIWIEDIPLLSDAVTGTLVVPLLAMMSGWVVLIVIVGGVLSGNGVGVGIA